MWRVLRWLHIQVPRAPAIPLSILGDACTFVFTAALFTMARKWSQHTRPTDDDNDVLHKHNGILLHGKDKRNREIHRKMDGTKEVTVSEIT